MAKKNKQELLSEAKQRGLDVDDSMKADEIEAKLAEADDEEGPAETQDTDGGATGSAAPPPPVAPGSVVGGMATPPESTTAGAAPGQPKPTDILEEKDAPDAQTAATAQQREVQFARSAAVRKTQDKERKTEATQRALTSLASSLDDVPVADLQRFERALSTYLAYRSSDPATEQGTDLRTMVLALPPVEDDKTSVEKVAEAAGLEVEEVSGYSIRQATAAGNRRVGDKYAVVADNAGHKKFVKL